MEGWAGKTAARVPLFQETRPILTWPVSPVLRCGTRCQIVVDSGGYALKYAFQGMYEHSLDPKGRLTLPAPFREQLNDERQVVCALSLDKLCLEINPQSVWLGFLARLEALSKTDKKAVAVKRVLSWTAFPCELDRQGRVLVPHQLRGLVGIDREVKVAGAIRLVEVWDLGRWNEYFRQGHEQLAPNSSDLAL